MLEGQGDVDLVFLEVKLMKRMLQNTRKVNLQTTIELLESRRLLSAAIDSAGTLAITGTNQADELSISLKNGDSSTVVVSENGQTSEFKLSDVTGGVMISGGDGDDHITVDESNGAITLNVTVTGGNGKDVIHGGAGADSIDGGNGKDKIYGQDGNDWLNGGNGRDVVYGDDGDDVVIGGRGRALVDGGAGDDDLYGGQGKDDLTGDTGNDDFEDDKHHHDSNDSGNDDQGDNGLESLMDKNGHKKEK